VRACLFSPGRNRLRRHNMGSPARFRPRPFGPGRFLRVRPDYRYSGRFPASCLRAARAAFSFPVGLPSSALRLRPVVLESRRLAFRPACVSRFGSRHAAQRPCTVSRETPPRGLTLRSAFRPAVVGAEAPPYRPFAVPSPGGLRFRRTAYPESGFGFRFRVGLALLPSARPAFASMVSPLRDELSRFRRSRSARFVSEEPRPGTSGSCHALPSRPSGFRLWITGISGITWIKRGTASRPLRNRF